MTLILAALVLFVAGCANTGNSGSNTAFIGGTEGLRSTFMAGNPPEAVFDASNSNFAIVVKLENIGENTVNVGDGYVKINGLDPGTFGVSTLQAPIGVDINGAVKNFDGSTLNGGIATVEFPGLHYIPSIQGNLQQTVWADVCYKYATKATAQLCIKKNAEMLINNKKICDVEGEKNPQNSGAPIQVTSLKENFAGSGKIGVTLVITHKGKGDNFFKDSDTVCDDVESNPNRGKVHVRFNPMRLGSNANVYPVCNGLQEAINAHDGYVRLFKDSSGAETYSLYCTVDATTQDSVFQIPVDVELTYLYLQHMEQTLNIRHATQ